MPMWYVITFLFYNSWTRVLPRLIRSETTLVISVLRDEAGRGSLQACRLLHRLENALTESIDGVRAHRRQARARRAKQLMLPSPRHSELA